MSKEKMNKKGAELTIATLVIIVLAVIVLIVLVVGFTSGWGNLWGNISQFFGGGANLDSQVTACKTACLTKSVNAWCKEPRTVRASNEIFPKVVKATGEFATPAEISDNNIEKITSNKVSKTTCKVLIDKGISGFETCSDITCPP